MPGDPSIFTAIAADGMMKNSFTMLRKTFPNRHIHVVIRENVFPFRIELARRPEFQSDVRWDEQLVLYSHLYLQNISDAIKRFTHRPVLRSDQPLQDRLNIQRDFIAAANDPSKTLEDLIAQGVPTHNDQVLQPATPFTHTLTFDETGNDPDFPQPTVGRYPDPKARILVYGLDRLVVNMSISPSADAVTTINENDAAIWQSWLVDAYQLVQRAGTTQTPYTPTGIRRSQLDNSWNADGKNDRPYSEGEGRHGDVVGGGTLAAAAQRRN